MTYVCEICVMVYVTKLIELERIMPEWNESGLLELLLAIGEEITEENLKHLELAKEFF
jgi:hypothetical protein